jgi:resA
MKPQRLNQLAKMLGISAVVFFSVSCKEESAQIGQPAPEIAAFDLQGNKASLSDCQGKTVLINFWSETCGACIAELRTLQQWAEKYPNQVQLIAMNIDGEKADTQAIVTKRQLTLPVFKDQMKITAERYQLVGTPTSFVIDPNGKVIYKFEGLISENDLQRLFQPTKS